MVIRLGKVRICIDDYVSVYSFGITFIPKYSQFEINFGRYALNFWYQRGLVNHTAIREEASND